MAATPNIGQLIERNDNIRNILGDMIERAQYKIDGTFADETPRIAWARILLEAAELELEFANQAAELELQIPSATE